MLLQRIGRLWRHKNTNRPDSAKCEAWFIAPTLEKAFIKPDSHKGFGNTAILIEGITISTLDLTP